MTDKKNTSSVNNRILWLDIAKALALFLVIAGHTIGGQFLVQTLSFGVCSFFIFSGMTSYFSRSKTDLFEDTVRTAKKLLLPPAITYLLLNIYIFISQLVSRPFMEIEAPLLHPHRMILTLIFSRCNNVLIGSYEIKEIGILWFFAALFSSLFIYNCCRTLLSRKLLPLAMIFLSICGYLLARYGIILPLNIDIAMTLIPFLYFGDLSRPLIQKYPSRSLKLPVIVTAMISSGIIYAPLCYLVNMRNGMNFDLASASYYLYPLCIIMPLFGSIALVFTSMTLERLPKVMSPIILIGQNTLYLFSFHSVDRTFINIWELTSNNYVNYIVRLLFDLAVMCIIILFVRKWSSTDDNR